MTSSPFLLIPFSCSFVGGNPVCARSNAVDFPGDDVDVAVVIATDLAITIEPPAVVAAVVAAVVDVVMVLVM